MVQTLVQVLCGTGFTFLMTTLGAAVVFCFRGAISDKLNCAFLGFASGVMMAAAVWSLLVPSIEQSGELKLLPWLPPAAGFALGGIFLHLEIRSCHGSRPMGKGKKQGRSFWYWQ